MIKHRFVLSSWVSSACLALGIASAYAQEPPQGPRMPRNEMKPGATPERRGPPERHPGGPAGEQMRDNMDRHRMHDMMRNRDASVPPPFGRKGDAGVRRKHRPVLTPDQIAKRNEELAKLRAKFGDQHLERRDVRMELNVHAWRVARLRRMRMLAEEQKKPKLVERIDALMKKENQRHDRRMERLRADGGTAPLLRRQPAPLVNTETKTGGQP